MAKDSTKKLRNRFQWRLRKLKFMASHNIAGIGDWNRKMFHGRASLLHVCAKGLRQESRTPASGASFRLHDFQLVERFLNPGQEIPGILIHGMVQQYETSCRALLVELIAHGSLLDLAE